MVDPNAISASCCTVKVFFLSELCYLSGNSRETRSFRARLLPLTVVWKHSDFHCQYYIILFSLY